MSDDRFLPSSCRSALLTPYVTGKYGGAGFRAWNYRVSEAGLTIIVLSNVGEHEASWVTALRAAITKAID